VGGGGKFGEAREHRKGDGREKIVDEGPEGETTKGMEGDQNQKGEEPGGGQTKGNGDDALKSRGEGKLLNVYSKSGCICKGMIDPNHNNEGAEEREGNWLGKRVKRVIHKRCFRALLGGTGDSKKG